MSRSYKKSPVCNDHCTPGTRWAKNRAARAVRRCKDEIADGKAYRKLYCSWNIHDYRFYKTRTQAIHEWETTDWIRLSKLTRQQAIQKWSQYYRRK